MLEWMNSFDVKLYVKHIHTYIHTYNTHTYVRVIEIIITFRALHLSLLTL